ncbi:uncharacterized protein MELLADRAFT_72305 [Melampsora larici-populina 98AG31]|uniref:Uncharacterized protein n=1 Tax=Melampsora larici-populina (strain 98AG31 / pathotype 3-4-7) TaxID=747676 RepID=F4RSA7_MELLP|nr:uncharacterized protein MELLADRAFT_72305 [Melampsora larici-populina 98AG31]EGG04723.1 hypothetical protein MELLADRAFT_72305 [Melampsora larici-populina 98AG31]
MNRSTATSNALTNENILPSTNSKVSINIFPTTHTRFLHKQVKASSGIASPLSKPTLYGTEHMYGHSTAPFGELYDNTDMSFLYELTRPAPGVDSGSSKN